MKKIGFIGAYDKTDLILSIAKVLTVAGRRVLLADTTEMQKSKYVVPAINPTKSYITQFEEIDVAVGFERLENIKQYLGIEDGQLPYDVILIDTDSYQGVKNMEIQNSEKIYYVTAFDIYSLKKGLEILNLLEVPLHMKKIFYTKEMLKEEQDYFDFLSLGIKAEWEEEKIFFLLENGDQIAIAENQRLAKIKFRNLSPEYKENLVYLVNDIDKDIGERQIKNIIKNL